MKLKITLALVLVLLFAVSVYAGAPRGTVPRAAADRYPAHVIKDGLSLGAEALTPKQVRKVFATDVGRCCVVVEVALYPQKDGSLKVSLNDFVLRLTGTDVATRPSGADVVATKLQRQNAPPPSSGHDVVVSPTVGVGYETGGIDPVTGQRRPGGVVLSSGAGVGIGGSQPPKPGSTEADRRTMELELSEKGLPEGYVSAPVSGYVYFSLPSNTGYKKGSHQLEYTLNGNTVVLRLP